MILSWLSCLKRDANGSSATELTLVMPVLATLILVSGDLGTAFTIKMQLETAAEQAAQMAIRGGISSSSYEYIRLEAAQVAGVAQENVSVTSSMLCDGVAQASADHACEAGQQVKRYLNIGISYPFSPAFPSLMPIGLWGAKEEITLTGAASVRLQ